MANYTKTTDFEVKDGLPSGDPGKIIKGTEFEVEFDAISTAIATKADQAGPTFTGTSTFGDLNVTGSFTSLGIDDNGTTAAITIDATNDVAITNGLTVDGTTLVVDDTNNTVGIGTANPTEALTVNGTGYFFNASAEIKLAPDAAIGLDFGASYTSIPAAQNHGYVATATSGAGGANGDLLIASRTSALTNIRFITGSTPTERMRIDSSGNVGVGTSSPSAALTVRDDAASADTIVVDRLGIDRVVLNNAGVVEWGSQADQGQLTWDTGKTRVVATAGNTLELGANGRLNDLVIDSSGQVGIGVSAPAAQLDVVNEIAITGTTGPLLKMEKNDGTLDSVLYYNNSNSANKMFIGRDSSELGFRTSSTERITINATGNVGIGIDTPTTILDAKGGPVKSRNALTTDASRFELANDSGTAFGQIGLKASSADMFIGSDTVQDSIIIQRSSGNVGIGTDSPDYKLTIDEPVGTADTEVAILNDSLDSSAALWLGHASTRKAGIKALKQSTGNDHDLLFYTNPSASDAVERMRIDSSGNVLVGTTSAASGGTKGFSLEPATNDRTIGYWASNSTSSINLVAFRNPNGTVGTISTSGSATAYNTSSDERLKENIVDAPAGNIDALQVRSFDWKVNGEHQTYGFIAQELEPVAPYAVSKGDAEDDMWSVDYSKLVPMLVKEIQDLKAEVEALKNA